MLEKFRETAIMWDKANRKVYESLRASAGDNKGRKLSVQLVNDGVIEDLSGASLSLFWETKDKAYKGLDAFTAVDATKGEFEIFYTTGMLSNEGTLNANLVLVDTSGRVVSEPFTITVFKGIDDDAIQSSDSFTALTEALAQVGTINNKADRDELLALESTFEQNKNEVTAQLQQTEQELTTQINLTGERVTTEVDNLNTKLSNTLTGTPKIVANTVATLPAIGGAEKIALVLENGHLYYDNGSTWVDVGLYQNQVLGSEFDFRGVKIGGDANLTTDSGLYFMTATSANLPAATSMMIETKRFGSRFVQIARRFDNPVISWVRGGDLTNISSLSWRTDIGSNSILTSHIAPKAINNTLMADNSVGANNLMDGYDYVGFYFGADKNANNLTKSGLYYVASSVLNLPKRNYFGLEAVGVIMKVEKYNTRIIQTARPINYPNEVYYRYTETTFEGVAWIHQQRESKPLYGKNVILMGDSLTEKGKQHLTIWEKTGANVDKIGIGGTTMSNHGNSQDYSKLSFYSLAKAISTGVYTEQETAVANIYTASSGLTDLNAWLTKFKAIDWNAINYILVRYGTNDHAMNNVIGAIDRTNFDTSTYIGAFNQGVKDILTAYPHIRIFVATQLWRFSPNIGAGGDSDLVPNTNGDFAIDFVDALAEVAGQNHLPFHDYYRRSGINAYTNTHYLSDQTHLNDAGSLLIGEIDSNFLTSR